MLADACSDENQGLEHASFVDIATISMVFVASAALTILAIWLHIRLAGTGVRPGAVSMLAFVLGWLSGLTAFLTGAFLLYVAVSR